MWSAEGSGASNTLTGADGLYNGRSVSRQAKVGCHFLRQPSALVNLVAFVRIVVSTKKRGKKGRLNWIPPVPKQFGLRRQSGIESPPRAKRLTQAKTVGIA